MVIFLKDCSLAIENVCLWFKIYIIFKTFVKIFFYNSRGYSAKDTQILLFHDIVKFFKIFMLFFVYIFFKSACLLN